MPKVLIRIPQVIREGSPSTIIADIPCVELAEQIHQALPEIQSHFHGNVKLHNYPPTLREQLSSFFRKKVSADRSAAYVSYTPATTRASDIPRRATEFERVLTFHHDIPAEVAFA